MGMVTGFAGLFHPTGWPTAQTALNKARETGTSLIFMDRLSLSVASPDEHRQARSCKEQREGRRLRHGQDLTAKLAVRLPCGGDVLVPQAGFQLGDLGVSKRKGPCTERRDGRTAEAIIRGPPKSKIIGAFAPGEAGPWM